MFILKDFWPQAHNLSRAGFFTIFTDCLRIFDGFTLIKIKSHIIKSIGDEKCV